MVKMFIESMKNLVEKPATIGYPHTPSPSPKDYRGTIHYQEDLCIFCDLCEEVCPPGAILFEITNFEENIREYSYNPYLCIYCHACVDVCPKADEGCLVQAETRLKPLGRDETLPDDVKLGYFMQNVTTAKNLDRQWDEFEDRCEEAREGYDAFKAEKKRLKKEAAAAKKKAEADAKAKDEVKEEPKEIVESSKEAEAKTELVEEKKEISTEAKNESKEEPKEIVESPKETEAKTEVVEEKSAEESSEKNVSANEPALLTEARSGGKDNLSRIKGIGPKIEETLNAKGIFHFDQIASWTEDNVKWADETLSFSGRVTREEWIEQAKVLASGEETEFSKKVDDGKVASSKKS